MINKIMPRGKKIGGLVRYLFGPGDANEHRDQRIIAADPILGLPDGTRLNRNLKADRERIAQLARDLDAHRVLAAVAPERGWVWHCAISLRPGERLTDIQWAHVARAVVEELKFTGDPATGRAPCRWIAIHHGPGKEGNDHIHLAVNLVREDGKVAAPGLDRKVMSRVCADLEARFGLSIEEGRATGGLPSTTRAEHGRVARGERDEPDRLTLARHVRAAELLADDEAEFVTELVAAGLRVQPRWGPGKTTVTGYSVALQPAEGGKPIWYGGGKLAPDLTLPRLRAGWQGNDPARAVDAWKAAAAGATPLQRRPTAGDLNAWVQATAQVNALADQLEKTPITNTITWARAARETAGVYAVLWRRTEADQPGPLAGAIDALARSAQHRKRGAGDASYHRPLRGAARVVQAAVPHITGRAREAWVALIRALIRLVDAILKANQARGQALRALELANASRAQLDRIQQRAQPRAQARPAPHGMTDQEMAHVTNAIRHLNAIPPHELLRRGSSTRSRAPRPNPMLKPEQGFGL